MINFDFDAHEARLMENMAKDMDFLTAIMDSLEARPAATLETIGTPEYEAKYAAWETANDALMRKVRERIAEKKGNTNNG